MTILNDTPISEQHWQHLASKRFEAFSGNIRAAAGAMSMSMSMKIIYVHRSGCLNKLMVVHGAFDLFLP